MHLRKQDYPLYGTSCGKDYDDNNPVDANISLDHFQ